MLKPCTCDPKAIDQDIGDDWSRAGLEPILELVRAAVRQGEFSPDPLVPIQIQPSREVFEAVKLRWLQSQA